MKPLVSSDQAQRLINETGQRFTAPFNELWTHFFPHARRGTVAMNVIGILPHYHGILCHDHWKSYIDTMYAFAV